jgi:hypothetical protein
MRRIIYETLKTDPQLQALGLLPSAIRAGDVDTPMERPFVDLRWLTTPSVPNIGGVGPRLLTVWVHDQPNDYERIDAIIRRIKAIFAGLVGVRHETGYITLIEWTGDGEDGLDDGHGTIFRTTSHGVVGSGA